jgi:hypothetical protein
MIGFGKGTSDEEIKDAIYHMSETYFTKLDTEYTFTHDFIFEAIAYHYGRQNKHQILKYLPSSYIANKVTVYEQASHEFLTCDKWHLLFVYPRYLDLPYNY